MAQIKLEEGHWYTNIGEGILCYVKGISESDSPYSAETVMHSKTTSYTVMYMPNGKYMLGSNSDLDLVQELPEEYAAQKAALWRLDDYYSL